MFIRRAAAPSALLLLVATAPLASQRRSPPAPRPPSFFVTPLTLDQMKGKQVVIETSLGPIVTSKSPVALVTVRIEKP